MNVFKSFWIMVKRFKTSLLMNLIGLSVAFAAFTVIVMQVVFENNYETQNPKSDRVYRASLKTKGENYGIWRINDIHAIVSLSPHIAHWTSFISYGDLDPLCTVVQADSSIQTYRENISTADTGIISVLGLEIIEGDPKVLESPDKWLIPQSTARKMFGSKSAIGQTVKGKVIGAVYKDRPKNSLITDWMFYASEKPLWPDGMNYMFLLELDSPEAKDELVQTLNTKLREMFKDLETPPEVELTLLKDVYYSSDVSADLSIKGDRTKTYVMLLVAILVILIAVINYVNFASALTPMRIKMINLQKVLGARVGGLRLNLLFESVVISLVAYIISLGIIHLLGGMALASYFSADISLVSNAWLLLALGGVALLVGVVAGLYPLYYMTSFPPIIVLNGSFGMSPKGRKYRSFLVAVQFVISFVLITCTIFINRQNAFVSQYDLGFDKDQVVYTQITKNLYSNSEKTLLDHLKSYSDIENAGFAYQNFGGTEGFMFCSDMFNGKEEQYNCVVVSPSFLDVMGIEVPEGRRFRESDENLSQVAMIFNQKTKELDAEKVKLDATIGRGAYRGNIVGFLAPDFHYLSLRQKDSPMCFAVMPNQYKAYGPMLHLFIRVKAGSTAKQAVAHINEAFAKVDRSFLPELKFMDGIVDSMYQKEQRMEWLITALSVLAIIISLVGVFGLVMFETQYRRKEIGIRRVHGASVKEILMLINRKFLYIMSICFLLSIPVSYKFTEMWLSNFAYRIEISWWVFMLALLIIVFITLLTVTIRSYGAAVENPSNSIKNE